MIAALIILVTKQYHVTLSLFVISIIALIGLTIVSGEPLGTSGNAILDVFELVTTTSSSSLKGTLLTIASVLGYVTYTNKLEASQLFATIIARPLSKLKKPYLMAALVICLCWVLKLVIPSGLSMLSLVIGIIYPVLLSVGASRQTCATAFLLGTVALWGPSESGVYICLDYVENANVAEFFTKYEVPIVLINMVVMLIVFPISQRYFDKKEHACGVDNIEQTKNIEEYTIPKYYAVFPLFPLMFVLLFSDLCIKSIKITVPTACFLSLIVVIIIRLISEHKDIKQIINDSQLYFDGIGNFLAKIGFIIVAGTFFSTAITKIGGISYIIQKASSAGVSPFLTILITGVIAFITVAISGSINANIPLYSGVFYEIATISGLNALPVFNIFLLMACPGIIFVPFSGSTHLVLGTCNVEMMTVFKREAIPVAAIMLSTLVFSFLIFL